MVERPLGRVLPDAPLTWAPGLRSALFCSRTDQKHLKNYLLALVFVWIGLNFVVMADFVDRRTWEVRFAGYV